MRDDLPISYSVFLFDCCQNIAEFANIISRVAGAYADADGTALPGAKRSVRKRRAVKTCADANTAFAEEFPNALGRDAADLKRKDRAVRIGKNTDATIVSETFRKTHG